VGKAAPVIREVESINLTISSLRGLEKLPNLRKLRIHDNGNYTSLGGLETLPALEELDLHCGKKIPHYMPSRKLLARPR